MKQLTLVLIALLGCSSVNAQDDAIRLLVRADDMGASRSANFAAIEAFEKGIVRSVEVMVPGAWFEEAAILLRDRPDLDVGIHLTLTSEWTGVKWRPLTHCPSITDDSGYFLPFVWANQTLPQPNSIVERSWDIDEIEAELRAQIELGLRRIPHVSHLSEHMGCLSFSDTTKALLHRLATEYGLSVNETEVLRFPAWSGSDVSATAKTANLLRELDRLAPGTYLLVEHPAYDDLESQGMGHVGYENVAEDRAGVLAAFVDSAVLQKVDDQGIQLISYRDLRLAEPARGARTGAAPRPPVRWINPDIPAAPGLRHHVLPSKALGHNVGFSVWLPPGYQPEAEQRYPVIYFLHGMGGNESADAGGFSSWVEKAIEAGNLPPAICVFPNGGRSGYRGDVEKMIIEELIPHVDREFRTVGDGANRAVVGFSMGGSGSVHLATAYPQLFCVVGSMGGGLRLANDEAKQQLATVLPDWKRNNTGFFMVNGDSDRPDAFLEFATMLRDTGLSHELVVLENTGHNLGHYYERSVSQLLSFIGKHLGN